MPHFVIEHPQYGFFVELRLRKNGTTTPGYTWKHWLTAKRFPSRAAAQAFRDKHVPKRCLVVERE